MKISNSKKQLAEIIHANGGWRDGAEWSIQDRDKNIEFMTRRPEYMKSSGAWYAHASRIGFFSLDYLLPNWHQTILSRDEYFHLYPVADAAPEPVAKLTDEERCIHEAFIPKAEPTIEQLASDYRNAKDYADRKQQEADAAKVEADAKLAELVAAGRALGLVLSVACVEPELVITDWRDLRVGDEVECVESNVYREKYRGMVGTVLEVDGSSTPYLVDFGGDKRIWCHEVKFIRRP